ncbi:MAG: hypothetical protein AAFU78_21285 [Cyanobacteria bacterium J06633_2]
MKRRTLLKVGLFSLGMLLPSWLHAGSRSTRLSSLDKEMERHILSVFRNLNGAKAIGKAYLNRLPDSIDEHALLAHLCDRCSQGTQALYEMDDKALHQWLNEQQKRDFIEGNTVWLEGWLLSQTEVELCALAAFA